MDWIIEASQQPVVLFEKYKELQDKKSRTEEDKKIDKLYLNYQYTYFKEQEYKYFLSELDKIDEFYIIIHQFLYETAARVGEARCVRYLDIDFMNNCIVIKNSKVRRPNSNKSRVVFISSNLLKKISNYFINNNMKKTDYIFAKKSGKNSITNRQINNKFKVYVKDILGEEFVELAHAHTWRHTRIIDLLNHNVNSKVIKRLTGIVKNETLDIYSRYSASDIRKQIKEANREIGLK